MNIIFQGFDKQAAHNINNQNYIHIEEVNEGIGLYTVTSTQIFGAKKEFVKFCNFTDENNPLVEIGQNYPRIKNCLTEFTNVHITFEALHPFNNSISTHNAWQDNKKNRMLNHNRLTEYLYFAQEVEVCVPVIKE
ncbi:MAG TPA: hypothetical protein VMV56_05125 [Williamwhitmania sp.]|nr:hypothetical protein [Williamwhitmania sp.]